MTRTTSIDQRIRFLATELGPWRPEDLNADGLPTIFAVEELRFEPEDGSECLDQQKELVVLLEERARHPRPTTKRKPLSPEDAARAERCVPYGE